MDALVVEPTLVAAPSGTVVPPRVRIENVGKSGVPVQSFETVEDVRMP